MQYVEDQCLKVTS